MFLQKLYIKIFVFCCICMGADIPLVLSTKMKKKILKSFKRDMMIKLKCTKYLYKNLPTGISIYILMFICLSL